MTDDTLDAILAARCGAVGDVVNVDERQVKLVIFTLDGQWFALAGDRVREILADMPVFYLPGCPPMMEGVINVRGEIESVLIFRVLLGLPPADSHENSRILRCQGTSMQSGIRVDRVEEVMDVAHSLILPPPHTIPDHLKSLVLGVVQLKGHLVSVLDLDPVLALFQKTAP